MSTVAFRFDQEDTHAGSPPNSVMYRWTHSSAAFLGPSKSSENRIASTRNRCNPPDREAQHSTHRHRAPAFPLSLSIQLLGLKPMKASPRNPNCPRRYSKVAKIKGSADAERILSGGHLLVRPLSKPPPLCCSITIKRPASRKERNHRGKRREQGERLWVWWLSEYTPKVNRRWFGCGIQICGLRAHFRRGSLPRSLRPRFFAWFQCTQNRTGLISHLSDLRIRVA
jgi:hypothetical protein